MGGPDQKITQRTNIAMITTIGTIKLTNRRNGVVGTVGRRPNGAGDNQALCRSGDTDGKSLSGSSMVVLPDACQHCESLIGGGEIPEVAFPEAYDEICVGK